MVVMKVLGSMFRRFIYLNDCQLIPQYFHIIFGCFEFFFGITRDLNHNLVFVPSVLFFWFI